MSKQSWYGGDSPSPYVRRKDTSSKSWYMRPSTSLLVTFLLGIAVGFILRYAWFETKQEAPEQPPIPAGSMDTIPAESPPDTAPETIVPELDVAIQPANLEKIWPARHLIVGIPGTGLDPDTADMLNRYKPGGVWLRSSNTVNQTQIKRLVSQIQMLASLDPQPTGWPLIVAAQDGGKNRNILQLPAAPSYEDIALLETPEEIREAGKKTAEYALKLGVGVLLAPSLDVFDAKERHPSERPYFLGTTPEEVVRAGIPYMEGLQERGVAAFVKYYPGMGAATSNKNGIPSIKETNPDNLRNSLQAFADAASHDVAGILVGGVSVPALDTESSGRPATLSRPMIQDVLRQNCHYEGIILAEDILSVAAWSKNTTEQNIVGALAAGCDAILISSITIEEMEKVIDAIKQAVTDGTLTEAQLSISNQRLNLCRSKLARRMSQEDTEALQTTVPAEGEPEGKTEPSEAEATETAIVPEQSPEGQPEEEPATIPVTDSEKKTEAVKPSDASQAEKPFPPGTNEKIIHSIKQGETLTGIANKYGVSVKDIMQWNNLQDGNIKYGGKLEIHGTPPKEKEPESGGEKPEPVETPKAEPKAAVPVEEKPAFSEKTQTLSEEKPLAPREELTPAEELPALPAGTPVTTKEIPVSVETLPIPEQEPVLPLPTQEDSSANPNTPEVPPETSSADTVPAAIEAPAAVLPTTQDVPPIVPATPDTSSIKENLPAPTEDIPDEPSPLLESLTSEDQNEPTPPPSTAAETAGSESASKQEGNLGGTAPEAQASGQQPGENYISHVIGSGETLNKISAKYGVSVQEIIKANMLADPNRLLVGETIKVPKK